MLLPEPYELVDLPDGESITLRIDSWLDGSLKIHPKNPDARHLRIHMDQRGLITPPPAGTPIDVEIPLLRLYGQRIDAASVAPYWDVTSKTLRADLLARLTNRPVYPLTVRLTAHGHKPQKRYSVENA